MRYLLLVSLCFAALMMFIGYRLGLAARHSEIVHAVRVNVSKGNYQVNANDFQMMCVAR